MNKREFFGVAGVGIGSLFLPRILEGGEIPEPPIPDCDYLPSFKLTPESLYHYADTVLRAPLPECFEAIIAQSAEYSYWYAYHVLDGPFPAGEAAIAQYGYRSFNYAVYVLRGPFQLGEAAIASDALASFSYAKNVLKSRFRLGEPAIRDGAGWRRYCDIFHIGREFPSVHNVRLRGEHGMRGVHFAGSPPC